MKSEYVLRNMVNDFSSILTGFDFAFSLTEEGVFYIACRANKGMFPHHAAVVCYDIQLLHTQKRKNLVRNIGVDILRELGSKRPDELMDAMIRDKKKNDEAIARQLMKEEYSAGADVQ